MTIAAAKAAHRTRTLKPGENTSPGAKLPATARGQQNVATTPKPPTIAASAVSQQIAFHDSRPASFARRSDIRGTISQGQTWARKIWLAHNGSSAAVRYSSVILEVPKCHAR